jgi:hypothetical protein
MALVNDEELLDDNYKVLALYFDKLVMAVPAPAGPGRIWVTVSKDLVEADLMTIITLRQNDMNGAASNLVSAIEMNANMLRPAYYYPRGEFAPRSGRRSTFMDEWIPWNLAKAVADAGIGYAKENSAGWEIFRCPREVGQIYSSALAGRIANQRLLSTADSVHCPYSGASEWDAATISDFLLLPPSVTSVIPSSQLAEKLMAIVALQAVLPQDLSKLTIPQIVELRNKHRLELNAFQEFLQKIANSDTVLSAVGTPVASEALMELIQVEYERRIVPQLIELEKSMNKMGLTTVWNSLSIKTAAPPIVAQAAAPLLGAGPLMHTLMISSGIAVGAIGLIRDSYIARSKLRKESPLTYMLSLKRIDASMITELHRRTPRANFLSNHGPK